MNDTIKITIMKILLTNIIFCCMSFIQQQEPLSNIAIIKIPVKSSKLNKVDFLTYSNKNFKYSNFIKDVKHIYKTDNILIAFEDKDVSHHNFKSLSEMKDRMLSEGEEMQARGGTVEIIKIKNIEYLIFKQSKNKNYSYTFYSEANNKKYLEGSVIFKMEDKDKAEKIFFDLIKSVSFKK